MKSIFKIKKILPFLLILFGFHFSFSAPSLNLQFNSLGSKITIRTPATIEDHSLSLSQIWAQDRFLRLLAAGIGKSPEQKQELFLLGLDLIERIKNQSRPRDVEVSSLKNIEKIREFELRGERTLDLDVEEVQKIVRNQEHLQIPTLIPQNEETRNEIQKIKAAYQNHLDKEFTFPPKVWWFTAASYLGLTKYRQVRFFDLLFENSKDSQRLLQGLRSMAPEKITPMLQEFEVKIQSHLQQVEKIGENLLQSQKIRLPHPLLGKMITVILKNYFTVLPHEEKMQMLLAVMQKPEDLTPLGIFRRASRAAGPQFQKVFQVLGKNPGFSQELQNIFQSFQQDLPAASQRDVIIFRDKTAGDLKKLGMELINFEIEPIQVGTMAQLHRIKYKDAQQKIHTAAYRLKKPGLDQKLARENEALNLIRKEFESDPEIMKEFPNIAKLILDAQEMATEELIVKLTAEGQQKASASFTKAKSVRFNGRNYSLSWNVPQVHFTDGTDVIIMDWIDGVSFDELKKTHPEEARVAIHEWAKIWLHTSLLGDGFVHADPHPGNLRFQMDSQGAIRTHVLDYGMTGQVSGSMQNKFALLAIANYFNADALMARTLLELSENKNHSEDELRKKIETERINLQKEGKETKLDHWIKNFSMKQGLIFSTQFSKLARGYQATLELIQQSDPQTKFSDLMRELTTEDPSLLLRLKDSLGEVRLTDVTEVAGKVVRNTLENPGATVQKVFEGAGTLFKGAKGLFGGFFDRISQNSANSNPTVTLNKTSPQSKMIPATCSAVFLGVKP